MLMICWRYADEGFFFDIVGNIVKSIRKTEGEKVGGPSVQDASFPGAPSQLVFRPSRTGFHDVDFGVFLWTRIVHL